MFILFKINQCVKFLLNIPLDAGLKATGITALERFFTLQYNKNINFYRLLLKQESEKRNIRYDFVMKY